MVSRVDVKMDSTPTLIEAKYWEPSCTPHADHVRGRGLAVASVYKPCPDRGDGGACGGVLLDIDGPVGPLLPHGRLVVAVDNVELNINIGVEGRRAAVRRPHADHEPLFLWLRGRRSMGDRQIKLGVERGKGGFTRRNKLTYFLSESC